MQNQKDINKYEKDKIWEAIKGLEKGLEYRKEYDEKLWSKLDGIEKQILTEMSSIRTALDSVGIRRRTNEGHYVVDMSMSRSNKSSSMLKEYYLYLIIALLVGALLALVGVKLPIVYHEINGNYAMVFSILLVRK